MTSSEPAAVSPKEQPESPPPGCYPDPGGSGGARHWDGSAWAADLATHDHLAGEVSSGHIAPGWYTYPDGSGALRWWDGAAWDRRVMVSGRPWEPPRAPVRPALSRRRAMLLAFGAGLATFLGCILAMMPGAINDPAAVPDLGTLFGFLTFFALLAVAVGSATFLKLHPRGSPPDPGRAGRRPGPAGG